MYEFPRLTPRLRLAADFVRPGRKLADVGTDHAYLPVYLVDRGIVPSAVASDIHKGPLTRARDTVDKYDDGDFIRLVLTDGLEGIGPEEADDIVMAGMGGDLIADIITRCPWLKNSDKHLVLQPMTAEGRLRSFLCRNGFHIDREAVAKEGDKLYLVISAVYTGESAQTDLFFETAGILPQAADFETSVERIARAREYLLKQYRIAQKKARGLEKAVNPQEAALSAEAEKLASALWKSAENLNDSTGKE